MINTTKTPMAVPEQMAMGLGGEDIITDGASQIRIEQDIKEMQGLLPPLLETASTKQFFKDDEINAQDREAKKNAVKKIKEDAIPLQYIRDNSKLSDISTLRVKDTIHQRSQAISNQRKRAEAAMLGAGNKSPSQLFGNEMMTTGIQYSPTPLSVLQENPLKSEIGAHSLLRQSQRDSTVSITIKHQKQGSMRHSTIGPYLKSFTQRIKLPNLNRSTYAKKLTNSLAASPNRTIESPSNVAKRRSDARSSIVTKQNNVFTTVDEETGGILEKRMANNFQVKIKQNISQSRRN